MNFNKQVNSVESNKVEAKASNKNFAKNLLKTLSAKSSKVAIMTAVAFALSQNPVLADDDGKNNVRQIITNTDAVFNVDGKKVLYENIGIPTYEWVIKGEGDSKGYAYDRCTIVDFPAIEGFSRVYWVDGKQFGQKQDVPGDVNIEIIDNYFDIIKFSYDLDYHKILKEGIIRTDYFFNFDDDMIKKTLTPKKKGGYYIRECEE